MSRPSPIHIDLTIAERDKVDTAKWRLRLVPPTLKCIAEAAGVSDDDSKATDALTLIAVIVEDAVGEIDDAFAAAEARQKVGAR